LIDFDSFYHPSLKMPKATTCGTVGYAPPFAWRTNVLDPKRTWCPHADRYTLTILIAEFLTLDRGWPLTAEGGMFDQDELRARSGPGLDTAKKVLNTQWPRVASLFVATINSKDFEFCPSPRDWRRILGSTFPKPPSLSQLENIPVGHFKKILRSTNRAAAPLWPPPNLSEIPKFKVESRRNVSNVVVLPLGPWN